MDRRRAVGKQGEDYARRFLEDKGYRTVVRNYRALRGELDLIMEDGSTCVFVEVKSNVSKAFGPPELRVTPRKQQQLVRIARAYIQEQDQPETEYRFDVVAVEMGVDLSLKNVRHPKEAFWASAEGI